MTRNASQKYVRCIVIMGILGAYRYHPGMYEGSARECGLTSTVCNDTNCGTRMPNMSEPNIYTSWCMRPC